MVGIILFPKGVIGPRPGPEVKLPVRIRPVAKAHAVGGPGPVDRAFLLFGIEARPPVGTLRLTELQAEGVVTAPVFIEDFGGRKGTAVQGVGAVAVELVPGGFLRAGQFSDLYVIQVKG